MTLLPCLLGVTMIGGMLALLVLQLQTVVRQTSASAAQQRAVMLAHSGIEFGRFVLAGSDPDSLLRGADGVFSAGPVDRNPVPVETALALQWPSAMHYTPASDDGWPSHQESHWEAAHPGRFFLRFSNDWTEGTRADGDGRLLLRSLGLAAARGVAAGAPRNHIAIIEAELQREQGLLLESPVMVLGDLELSLDATSGIRGGRDRNVTLLPSTGPPQWRWEGGGAGPPDGLTVGSLAPPLPPALRRLGSGVWANFAEELSHFAGAARSQGPPEPGFYALGARPDGDWEGVAVSRGETVLPPGFHLDGLLVHLGPGPLRLEGADILGGVWMAVVEGDTTSRLQLEASARVCWDAASLERALTRLPVSVTGWRLVAPGDH